MESDPLNYCPICGTELIDKQVEDRTRRYCQQCEQPIYQNPKPCAGVLVVDEYECVLLVRRTEPPALGAWSIPAGYLEADEPPRQAAVRELYEETNVAASKEDITLFETAFVRHPDGQYVLVVIYVVPRWATTGTVVSGSDAGDAQFWSLPELKSDSRDIEPGYKRIFTAAVKEFTTTG